MFTEGVGAVGDLFSGGGYADINLGDPDIDMLTNVSGAAEYGLGGIGDMWDVGELQNFYEPVSGQFVDLTDAVFNYGKGSAYSGLADIGGYMGLVGDVGGFMEGGAQGGPVSWMGQNISPSGAPGTEAAMQGTPSGSSTGLGQQPSSGGSGSSGGSRQGATGAGTGKPSSVVPDTIQKLANIATATGGMMPTPPLRPGKSVSATQMMPKVPPRNTTAAQYIMHYSKVAGTKPASFKLT
jgi:hypothetical protein